MQGEVGRRFWIVRGVSRGLGLLDEFFWFGLVWFVSMPFAITIWSGMVWLVWIGLGRGCFGTLVESITYCILGCRDEY